MSRFLVKVAALGFVLLVCAVGGVALYARHCWTAAQKEVAEFQPEAAQKHLRLLLFLRPDHIPYLLLAARAARINGEFDEAERYLNKCLKLAKGSTEEIQVEFLLMRVQRGEEDVVSGELLQYVYSGYPESKLILETLAHAYIRNMRSGMAFTCLTMRIDLGPDDAQPYEWRGRVLENLNDRRGALADYAKAVELEPGRTTARLRLAELQMDTAQIEEAAKNLELLAGQFPDRSDVKARLGQCRLMQGNPDEARPLLEAAVQEMPDDAILLLTLSKLEMYDHNWSQAEHWLRHSLEIDPTDLESRFNLVTCLEHAGKRQEADAERDRHQKDSKMLNRVSKILQSDAEHPSRDPDALYEVGSVFLNGGNARVGLWWLNRALQLNPNHQATRKTLAEYYESKGDKDLAAQHRRYLKPAK